MDLSVIGSFSQENWFYNTKINTKENIYQKFESSNYNEKANNPKFDGLTEEQNKQVYKAWEEFNNKDLNSKYTSSQKWDVFLSELEKNGLITSEERLLASGNLIALPELDKNGQVGICREAIPNEEEQLNMLEQDPIKWLDYFIFYQSKISHISKIDGYTTKGIDEQIAACKKVQNIINHLGK